MNKRIKKKYEKLSNTARQENILKAISKYFTIENKQFGNGYFIFSKGENAVCHFELKETPNWKYGIWLEDEGFEIFGEYTDLIDKFKPSRCYVSYKNIMEEFVEEVKNISKNPKLYFVDSLTFGDALEKHQGKEQEDFVNNKYEEYQNEKIKRLEDKEFDRIYAFNFFKELVNVFDGIIAVGIVDKNKGSWKCTPRYNIRVVIDNKLNDDDFNKLYDDLENLIRDRNYSDKRKTREHQFNFQDCFDNLEDIKKCDYKYYININ